MKPYSVTGGFFLFQILEKIFQKLNSLVGSQLSKEKKKLSSFCIKIPDMQLLCTLSNHTAVKVQNLPPQFDLFDIAAHWTKCAGVLKELGFRNHGNFCLRNPQPWALESRI